MDELMALIQEAPAENNSAVPPSARWQQWAKTHNHDVASCRCVGCTLARGERPARGKRKKTARVRGYVWLSDEDDLRVRRAAAQAGMTNPEWVRLAIYKRLDEVEG